MGTGRVDISTELAMQMYIRSACRETTQKCVCISAQYLHFPPTARYPPQSISTPPAMADMYQIRMHQFAMIKSPTQCAHEALHNANTSDYCLWGTELGDCCWRWLCLFMKHHHQESIYQVVPRSS